MGVGSSREIEEQLEAALALLDAARSKQDGLRKENDALQARITAQAASLLLHEDQAARTGAINSVHLIQQREPLSKRVLFSMAVVAPLATHCVCKGLGLYVFLEQVRVTDPTALAQGVCLCLVFVLLLRLRRYRWRRIRPDRVVTRRPSGALESAGTPGTRSPRPSIDGTEIPTRQTSALLASEAELAVLADCKQELYRLDPRPPLLPVDEPLLDVQLIRFLREHGPNAGKIVSCYKRALEWRHKALPLVPGTEDPLGWLSASEMVYGDWATKFAHIGIFCGKSKIGCPVKIERLGKYDLQGLQESDPDFRRKFNAFYLSLIEFLQQRLDRLSLEEGRLVQTYEVFDLHGLGYHMMTMTVINFTKDILLNYSSHYPSSFRKAAVVNAPPWLPRMWRMISHVLPTSVKAKVKILDHDYYKELAEDLSDESLAWIECSNADLIRAPHPPPSTAASDTNSCADDPPLDGEPVVVDCDVEYP